MSQPEANPYAAPSAPIKAALAPAGADRYVVAPEFAAGIGARAAGLVLDCVWTVTLWMVAAFGCAFVVFVLRYRGLLALHGRNVTFRGGLMTYAGGFAGMTAYLALSEWVGGSSVGKALLGLRVVGEDFRWPTVWKTLGRRFAAAVDLLFLGLPAYWSMKGSLYHQRLGDHWGGTYVLRNAGLPEAWRRSTGRVLAGICVGSMASVVIMAAVYVGQGL